MQNQRGFVGVGVLIAILVGLAVLGGGAYYVLQQQAPTQATSDNFDNLQQLPAYAQTQQKQVTTNTQIETSTPKPSLKKFTSESGFQFQYPSAWTASNDVKNLIFARIVNPARAGKPDTDVPIEQLLVRRFDIACDGAQKAFAGKTALDSGWYNDNFAGTPTRTVCFQLNGVPIQILASAFDQNSKTIMDSVLASFVFTASESVSSQSP
jgi:type II secretory pathway pseudopilin PulG